MNEQKKESVKEEVKKFSFVGIVSTAIDYGLLNLGTIVFHLPLITANVISTSVATAASYRLNKEVVFEGRLHGRKETVILFLIINGVGIYIIQTIVLYLIGSHFDKPVELTLRAFENIGLMNTNEQIVSTNVAKACASLVAGVWNFVLLRKYVFASVGQKAKD